VVQEEDACLGGLGLAGGGGSLAGSQRRGKAQDKGRHQNTG
jgi:hypothetical protein